MAYRRGKFCKKRKWTPPYILLVAVLILAAAVTAGVLAKYITGFLSGYKQADAAEFYFLTDLAENTSSDPYPIYDGIIRFTVKNHDLLNKAQRKIIYSVSLDGTAKESGLILTGNAESEKTFAIPAGEDNHTVTITSSSPYAKTITLYFRVNTHYADGFYTVTPHGGWLELELYTGEKDTSVTVNFGTLQPDNTLALMADWSASGSGTLTGLTPYSHYHLIFFGDTSTEFTLTNQDGKPLPKS